MPASPNAIAAKAIEQLRAEIGGMRDHITKTVVLVENHDRRMMEFAGSLDQLRKDVSGIQVADAASGERYEAMEKQFAELVTDLGETRKEMGALKTVIENAKGAGQFANWAGKVAIGLVSFLGGVLTIWVALH